MNEKHAFLILAHNEFEVLKLLVEALDDPHNDIFIHFDAKVKELPELKTQRAGLKILTHRHDVRWCGFRMVESKSQYGI